MKRFWEVLDLITYNIWYPIRDFCMWPIDKFIEWKAFRKKGN